MKRDQRDDSSLRRFEAADEVLLVVAVEMEVRSLIAFPRGVDRVVVPGSWRRARSGVLFDMPARGAVEVEEREVEQPVTWLAARPGLFILPIGKVVENDPPSTFISDAAATRWFELRELLREFSQMALHFLKGIS